MIKNRGLKVLTYIVITYMLLALFWWAVLLHRKNNETFQLRTELLKERAMHDMKVSDIEVTSLPDYQEIKDAYLRQVYMILGEAIVFGITLMMGIFFIQRAYSREIKAAEKQKNFLLSITHELKSPLASINLIFSTFKRKMLPHEKIVELSWDGIEESTRLEELFNKILTATRLDKTYAYNFENTNLTELVSDLISGFSKLYPESNITQDLQYNIYHNIDKEGITSVVKNLLENAYKYSLEEKKIDVTLSETNGTIKFSVEDNGIGIEKNERRKIFYQFYRVGSEETRKSKGTGLGLYIVEKIVLAHKGEIQVEDGQHGGTKFTITL